MERSRKLRFFTLASAILIAGGMVSPVRAQENDDLQRGVARISLMDGEVSVQRGDSGEWVAGIINAPLLADDRISTGPNSRAEIQFDSAHVMRIGGNAEVRLTQLEYGRYQMELAHGTITYNVVRASSANAEVDTPSIAVRPVKQGVYRISVNDAGETEVTARSGQVEIYSPRGSQWLQSGQSLMARGNASDPEFQIAGAIPMDDWDRWNADRDAQLARVSSYQYVPQGVYGAEDLDTYGSWGYVAPYGYCWHPTVAIDAGWAPYRTGRWVWEDWYGWTWVSYDPWGWAPYHYGRWFWNAGGWWWYPGVIGRPHYWSPALVAFFGFGPGAGIGFGFANVGWVPLAPYETFHPWWGRGFYGGRTYIDRSIHITNVNITNVYRNARVSNGISGIGAGDFQSGHFRNVRGVEAAQIREAGLVRGQMPLGPTERNLRFSDRSVAHVPASRDNMRFFSHQQPSAVQRVPFAQQQRSFESSARPAVPSSRGGSPERGNLRQSEPLGNTSPRGAQNPGADGWRRFGAPGAVPSQQQPAAARSATPGNSNFGRFGSSRFASQPEGQQPLRVSPPVVRQRESSPAPQAAPRYQAPRQYGAPRQYSAPQPSRVQSAPRSNGPSRSAPRGGGGGGSHGGGSRGGHH